MTSNDAALPFVQPLNTKTTMLRIQNTVVAQPRVPVNNNGDLLSDVAKPDLPMAPLRAGYNSLVPDLGLQRHLCHGVVTAAKPASVRSGKAWRWLQRFIALAGLPLRQRLTKAQGSGATPGANKTDPKLSKANTQPASSQQLPQAPIGIDLTNKPKRHRTRVIKRLSAQKNGITRHER